MAAIIDGYSSLPPNPPPVSVCTTRMQSFGIPKRPLGFVDIIRAPQRTPHGHAFPRAHLRDHSLRLDIELLLRARFVLPSTTKSAPAHRRSFVASFTGNV